MNKIIKAFKFAEKKHEGQKDDSGGDYFTEHIRHVYHIFVAKHDCDTSVLCAALLHDTLEDTDTTYEELVKEFGVKVADLVNEVTHEGSKDEYGYYFPRLKTREGIMIKFADRLSNLSRMESWNIGRQEHYLKRSKFWKSERRKGK